MPNGFIVPTDWEEGMGYAIGVFCFPNSLHWRANVEGAIYDLTRARAYDFTTGNWRTIEPQTVDVWESFMTCDFDTLIQIGNDLIQTQRMLVAAIAGQAIDFEIETLPISVDYTSTGLANRLGPNVPQDSDNTLQATLARLQETLDALNLAITGIGSLSSQDLEDDIAAIRGALGDITTVLGGSISAPSEPL